MKLRTKSLTRGYSIVECQHQIADYETRIAGEPDDWSDYCQHNLERWQARLASAEWKAISYNYTILESHLLIKGFTAEHLIAIVTTGYNKYQVAAALDLLTQDLDDLTMEQLETLDTATNTMKIMGNFYLDHLSFKANQVVASLHDRQAANTCPDCGGRLDEGEHYIQTVYNGQYGYYEPPTFHCSTDDNDSIPF